MLDVRSIWSLVPGRTRGQTKAHDSSKQKAVVAVEKVMERVFHETETSLGMLVDPMVSKTEEMVLKQEEFARKGKPTHIDIGYHWTSGDKVDSIQRNGLLTKADRKVQNIVVWENGSTFGQGIYTGNDPVRYAESYGKVCFMVARLRGKRLIGGSRLKGRMDSFSNEKLCVLKSSEQCVPLMCFEAKVLFQDRYKIHHCHLQLQNVLDMVLNGDQKGTLVSCRWVEDMCRPPPLSPVGIFAPPGKPSPFVETKKTEEEPSKPAMGSNEVSGKDHAMN